MNNTMNELVKTIQEAVGRQAEQAKPTAYDTPATVRRIENGTAWVHIPGGVDETPVKLTIAANVGDEVQVRVSGGRAFLVGNGSAPPTDDTTAIYARTIATTAQTTAEAAQEVAESVEGIAATANSNASAAITLAEGIDDHFWSDGAGAHITEDDQETYLQDPSAAGGNTLITSAGMAVRHGTTQLAAFTSSGAQIGKNSENRLIITPIELLQKNADGAVFFNVNTDNGVKTISVNLSGESGSQSSTISSSGSASVVSEISIPSDLAPGTTVDLFSMTGKVKPQYKTSMLGFSITFSNNTFDSAYSDTIIVNQSTNACFDVPSTSITTGTNSSSTYTCDVTVKESSTTIETYTVTCVVAYSASENKCTATWTVQNTFTASKTVTITWTSLQGSFSYQTTVPYYVLGTSADAAVGAFSIVGGQGIYATSDNQAAFGKFNIQDSNDDYALIVGNGSDSANRSNALTVDWSGNVNAAGGVTVGGHSSAIGTVISKSQSTTTITSSNGTRTEVANVSLPPGVWVVSAAGQFAANTTGRRWFGLTVGSVAANTTDCIQTPPTSGGVTRLGITGVFNNTGSTNITVYLVMAQYSGGNLGISSGIINAVRIA